MGPNQMGSEASKPLDGEYRQKACRAVGPQCPDTSGWTACPGSYPPHNAAQKGDQTKPGPQ